jgi:hypothetical protein
VIVTDNRKRLLFVALAGIILYFGGDFVMRTYVDGPLEQKRTRQEQLTKKIKARKKDRAASKEAARKLAVLEKSSLPSDTEIARSLYRAWLLDLVEKSEFQTAHVDSGPATSRKGFYDALGFSVRGKGTLHQVVRFLYDFYNAGHLHKIQSLNLTPLGKGGGLDVTMTIEALVLPGTDRKNELSTLTSHRLGYHSVEDYGIIAQRNIFGVGGETDESHQAFLTAVTRDGEEPEIWITLRGQDKLLKLHQGSQFEIGHFAGTVVDIFEDDVIFESFGERWLLSIGEPLADSLAVPPEF